MKIKAIIIIFCCVVLAGCVSSKSSKSKNSSAATPAANNNSTVQQTTDNTIHLADPTIFYNKGTYYLYGTVEGNSSQGFLVYSSNDMKTWNISSEVKDGYALKKGDAFGDKEFWAPQVFAYNNKFYMAYVANENIAVAESIILGISSFLG